LRKPLGLSSGPAFKRTFGLLVEDEFRQGNVTV